MGGEGPPMIKGLHVVKSKKAGKPVRWYVYAWRGGPCIAKRIGGGEPTLTVEEHRAFQAAVEAASSRHSFISYPRVARR